jgi:hypothetical protein
MNLRFREENWLLFDTLSDYQLFKEYPVPWRKQVTMIKYSVN